MNIVRSFFQEMKLEEKVFVAYVFSLHNYFDIFLFNNILLSYDLLEKLDSFYNILYFNIPVKIYPLMIRLMREVIVYNKITNQNYVDHQKFSLLQKACISKVKNINI